MEIIDRSSPNFDERARGIDMLLLHYTGMPTGEAAMARLCDPAAKVSAHYTVDEDGLIFRHVAEEKRAWHAGVSCWNGEGDVNSRAVGIEIVNPGHEFGYRRFPAPQIEAVIKLAKAVISRHAIPAAHVLGHSDVAPARKEDPGELFPWKRLAEEGVGLWAEAPESGTSLIGEHSPVGEVRKVQELLARFGYCIAVDGQYGAQTRKVVTAFQRHFVPGDIGTADEGYADGQMITVLTQLIETL
jgi:N-acetylmuramoyl-L-alanine amidase